jgi:hypothetical protein
MIVRQRQARVAKMTAGIDHTQQWAAADGGLVGCEVEVAATMMVAMLLCSWWQDWMVDCVRKYVGACMEWRAADNTTRGGGV